LIQTTEPFLLDRTIKVSIEFVWSLLAVYEPDIFNRYIIGSPSLSWDDYSIFGYEENSNDKISIR